MSPGTAISRHEGAALLDDIVDLTLGHEMHSDRALKRLLDVVEGGLADGIAQMVAAITAQYPFQAQPSDEALEGYRLPRRYLRDAGEIAARYSSQLTAVMHTLLTRYFEQVIVHEYQFSRAMIARYYQDPLLRLAEAERWVQDIETAGMALTEYDAFRGFRAQMARIEPPPREYLDAIMRTPTPWDGRKWGDRLPYLDKQGRLRARGMTRRRLVRNLHEGIPVQTTVRDLTREMGVGLRHKARILARTETAFIQNRTREIEYAVAEKAGLVSGREAAATFDSRTCLECASYDGQRFEGLTGPDFPLHPFCRCFYIHIPAWAEDLGLDLGPRGSKIGPIEGNFDTWLHRMDDRKPGFAKAWLGGDYGAWEGGASLRDLAGSPLASRQVSRGKLKAIIKRLTI